MRIAKTYGLFPSVNGVRPQVNPELDDVYTYKNINLQTNYTGKIIVQNGHQKINKKAYTILNKLFGCKKLIQFTFENGNLIESKDLSEICRYIKHLSRIESILKLKRNLTPIQKRFLRDRIINYSELNKQETYNYYQNYFCDYSI